MYSWHELYHWAIIDLWYFDLLILCCILNITKLPRRAPGYHCFMILSRGTLSTYVSTKAKLCRHWGFSLYSDVCMWCSCARPFFRFERCKKTVVLLGIEPGRGFVFMWRIDWKTTMMCSTTFSVWPLWRLLVSNGRTLSYLFPGRLIGLKFTRRL